VEVHCRTSYSGFGHKTTRKEIDTDWDSLIKAVKQALTTNSFIPPFTIKASSNSINGKVFTV